MPKDFEGIVNDYSYTQNRELSWLRFNRRVLEEAADDLVPPLERLKFISIFSSNLDEFFMVRVGSLLDLSLVSPDEIDNKSGLDPAEQLQAIYEAIPSLLEIKGQLYSRVSTLLAQAGVQDLSYDDLTAEEQAQVDDYFRAVVLPVLSPQIVGQRHPSPRLDNKALYITALLRSKSGKAALGFVPCPASLPPIFPLPESRGRFLRLETILCHWTPTLFKKYTVEELCVISATRNADLSFDREKFEDSDRDFRTMMTQMLKKRANQAIVRLEMDRRPSQELLRLLGESIQVQTHQIYCDSAPLAMGYVYGLENALPEDLRRSLTYPPLAGGSEPAGEHDRADPAERPPALLPLRQHRPLPEAPGGGCGAAGREIHQDYDLPSGLHIKDRPDLMPGGGERERGRGPHGASRPV